MHEIKRVTDGIIISGIDNLDIARSCACGQSFRWRKSDEGFFGVVRGRGVNVSQLGDTLHIRAAEEIDAAMWVDYFDLKRDYAAIERAIGADVRLRDCLPYATGIRVFNQEPFETLISFIISANNNIKRISGIIDRLCMLAGESKSNEYEYSAFPKPEAIANLSLQQLEQIGSGYRAPFIKRSAAMIADGYELERLSELSLDQARRELLKFPGVGPKVADCVLLFSLHHTDAFPIDVWMDRAMRALFFESRQPSKQELTDIILQLGPLSGIVQQYVFHYARQQGIGIK
ncbi:MAG: DNA glycosylase [Clostridia bacterium]